MNGASEAGSSNHKINSSIKRGNEWRQRLIEMRLIDFVWLSCCPCGRQINQLINQSINQIHQLHFFFKEMNELIELMIDGCCWLNAAVRPAALCCWIKKDKFYLFYSSIAAWCRKARNNQLFFIQLILKSWNEKKRLICWWAAAYNAHFTMFNFMNLSLFIQEFHSQRKIQLLNIVPFPL